MEQVTRRNFLGTMGMLAAMGAVAATPGIVVAEETQDATGNEFVPAGGSFADGAAGDWTGTPAEIEALGGSTMPLEELNRRRRAYIDAQTDWTDPDGTVIPAWAVKVRSLINSYGMGVGNEPISGCFDGIMQMFDEELAEFYISMPMGKRFGAIDAAKVTGRSVEECDALLNEIADKGFLLRFTTSNLGTQFHHPAYFQGVVEYSYALTFTHQVPDGYAVGVAGDTSKNFVNQGTPTFYVIPCDKSVVDTGEVDPYDDYEAIIRSMGKLSISPCMCRYGELLAIGEETLPSVEEFNAGNCTDYVSPTNGLRVDTCLQMGDEAEYWLSLGLGREVSADEAIAHLKRNAEDGFILEKTFGVNTETICSCHEKKCGIINGWKAVGGAEDIANARAFGQISHYTLVVDTNKCLKCGACAERCPLSAITMDEETGLPKVNAMCFRCGQCAYICPAEARKLTRRPESECLEIPEGMLEDSNLKAAFRFEHGLIA